MARRPALGALDRELLTRWPAVIGVDEAGRGCLAGPVVAAAVAFTHIREHDLVRDSKELTPLQRERAAQWIRRSCSGWAVVESWVEVIDRMNVVEACRVAMCSAVTATHDEGSFVVVDAVALDLKGVHWLAENKADARYACVAAASILAKVHRDRMMRSLSARWPHWQWERNKGYGTLAHRQALTLRGPTHLHRQSFGWSPVEDGK
jgi:ribonuclease HII